MKRKKKLNIGKVFLIGALALALASWGVNNYYDYQRSHYEENNGDSADKYLDSLTSKIDKINIIMQNKDKYPHILLEMLARNLDMMDYVYSYLDEKGNVLSDNIGEVAKGKFPLLLQYDKRWGYGMYGDEVIAINGCGPTSLAIVIAGLMGRNDITPYDVATYAYQNGYYTGGTSWSFFTTGALNYGIKGTELPLDKNIMLNELKQNHPIICSMGKGFFTTTGHIIVITGLKDGKFIINDPNSKERSSKLWSYEDIYSQIRNLWSYQLME